MDDTLYDGTGLPPSDSPTEGQTPITVPAGSLDDRLTWVASGETQEERIARADEVYAHEQAAGDTDLGELSRLLTYHVYRKQNQAAVVVDAPPVLPDGGPQSDGDGASYEGEALSGPAIASVTDGSGAVAVTSTSVPQQSD